MIVKTTWKFLESPEAIWPRLCNSRLPASQGCWFAPGLPRPLECRLPGGRGEVGATRQCISDRGSIDQRILAWEEPRRLAFRMEKTDLYFKACVTGIVEQLDLVSDGRGGARVTRTTDISVAGPFRRVKQVLLWLGLKQIHRYVFRNWARLGSATGHRDSE